MIHVPAEMGGVTCMDLYWDAHLLAFGCATGGFGFIDVTKGVITPNLPPVHVSHLLAIRVLHRMKDDILVTISTDVEGT